MLRWFVQEVRPSWFNAGWPAARGVAAWSQPCAGQEELGEEAYGYAVPAPEFVPCEPYGNGMRNPALPWYHAPVQQPFYPPFMHQPMHHAMPMPGTHFAVPYYGYCTAAAAMRVEEPPRSRKPVADPPEWWKALEADALVQAIRERMNKGFPVSALAFLHLYRHAKSAQQLHDAAELTLMDRKFKTERNIAKTKSTSTLQCFVESCKRLNAAEVAVNSLERLNEFGFPRSSTAFHNVMKWVMHRDPALTIRAYQAMKAQGAKPNKGTAFHVIRALAELKQPEAAKSAAQEFVDNGVSLSATTQRILGDLIGHEEAERICGPLPQSTSNEAADDASSVASDAADAAPSAAASPASPQTSGSEPSEPVVTSTLASSATASTA